MVCGFVLSYMDIEHTKNLGAPRKSNWIRVLYACIVLAISIVCVLWKIKLN